MSIRLQFLIKLDVLRCDSLTATGPKDLRDLMSLHKYVSEDTGTRYLKDWSIRYKRPPVANLISAEQMYQSHLTKSLEWAYEQEVRIFWRLNEPDDELLTKNGERICRLKIPATAL